MIVRYMHYLFKISFHDEYNKLNVYATLDKEFRDGAEINRFYFNQLEKKQHNSFNEVASGIQKYLRCRESILGKITVSNIEGYGLHGLHSYLIMNIPSWSQFIL